MEHLRVVQVVARLWIRDHLDGFIKEKNNLVKFNIKMPMISPKPDQGCIWLNMVTFGKLFKLAKMHTTAEILHQQNGRA